MFGVFSAIRQYSAADYTITFFGFLFLAMPVFWFAVLLKQAGIWFNQKTGSQFLGTIGEKSPYLEVDTTWNQFTDHVGHLILPTITLALVSFASWTRYTRASMLEVLNSDYVRLARAKGLRRGRVMTRHALRTALIPLATVTALDIAIILGGAVITETIFQWHGMGEIDSGPGGDHARRLPHHGLAAALRRRRHRVQPHRRPPLRRTRPEDPL